MPSNNETELIALLKKATAFIDEQHEAIRALCENMLALTVAVSPLMLACTDADVLLQFKADMERILAETKAISRSTELH